MRKTVTAVAACAVSVMTCAGVREQFADPPPESRLQAWYHWTTTGITDECLAADLKAMGELGVGTAHVFMPGQRELPPNTQPLSDEWWKCWETAIREAKKNDIRLGFHNCPGWSSSGGKWIKPEDSMKVLVAAATDVENLAKPAKLAQPTAQHGFYRDIAVYAFPIEHRRLRLPDREARRADEGDGRFHGRLRGIPVRQDAACGADCAGGPWWFVRVRVCATDRAHVARHLLERVAVLSRSGGVRLG